MKIKAIKANILDSAELASHLTGNDCVLSALGAPGIHWSKITFYIDSIKSICAAMNQAQIKRLICITALYTKRKNK